MDEHNEHGLVFLGDNYFAFPSMLDDDDEEGQEEEEAGLLLVRLRRTDCGRKAALFP